MKRPFDQLVDGCLKGDRRAQNKLYDQFKGVVYGITLRYGKGDTDIQEIFQETFVKIFNKLHTLKDAQALPLWIKQTTIRTALNYYESSLKKNVWLEIENYPTANDDYELVLSQLTHEKLAQMISDLPDGYRMVFNLYVIDGFGHKEIAEMLGISENTSKSQLMHARITLQKKLKLLGIKQYEQAV